MEEKTKPQARTRDLGKEDTKTSCTACDSGCCRTDCQFALQHCRQNLYRTYSGNRCGSAYGSWIICTAFNADKCVCYAVWLLAVHQERQYSWEKKIMKLQRRSWQTAFH